MPTYLNIPKNYGPLTYASVSSIAIGRSYGPATAYINATTAMFNSALSVQYGSVDSTYIFVSDKCNTAFFGKEFKITGDVYLVKDEDYNKIWWTWTDSSMKKYIEDHHLKPVHYDHESYDAHYDELFTIYKDYLVASVDTEGLPIAAIVS